MKKSLAAFLSIIMIFALTACGSKTDSKWNYTKEDSAFFYEAFSDKALNQDDSGIDIIYVHDVELDENISAEDVLVFNYDELEEDENYEYVSYDLIKKYQIKTEKTEITHEPDRFLVYFYGGDDLFTNYGVLISKDVTADREYIITKTQKEYLGGENEYTGLKNLTFAPLFSYLDAHGVTMEKIIEDGVITESIAEKIAGNEAVTLKNVGNLCSYLGCGVEDIMKFEKSGVNEVAHEITWDTKIVKKQDYESTGIISFSPLSAYAKEHGITQQRMIQDGVIRYPDVTRIISNHNYTVRFIMTLCQYLQTDVSNVIKFEDTSSRP
ncbi:MAG: hypothetical protein IJT03_03080 [Clostridia bacterium]|nr:hypothetical protein [Clostridia bacterium]